MEVEMNPLIIISGDPLWKCVILVFVTSVFVNLELPMPKGETPAGVPARVLVTSGSLGQETSRKKVSPSWQG